MAVTAPAPARPLDVTALGDARYRVIDHAGSGALHTVDSHGALCDCKAFKYGGGSCKHIDAVARFQEGTDSGPSLKRDVPLPDQEPEDETRDDPELVHDDDPVTAALARIGLDALRSATDGRLHDALLRLGQEAAVLDALDAGLLEFEAAKQLTRLCESEARTDLLIAAAIAQGRRAMAAADAPPPCIKAPPSPARATQAATGLA